MTVRFQKSIFVWVAITAAAITTPLSSALGDVRTSGSAQVANNPFDQIYGSPGDKIQELGTLVRQLKADGLTDNQIALLMEAAPDIAWRIERSKEAGFSENEIFTQLGLSNADLPRQR